MSNPNRAPRGTAKSLVEFRRGLWGRQEFFGDRPPSAASGASPTAHFSIPAAAQTLAAQTPAAQDAREGQTGGPPRQRRQRL